MSAIAAATIGSAIVGGIVASESASSAANAQTDAANLSAQEQRAARDQLTQLLSPYRNAGIPALQAQMDLLGIGGSAAVAGTQDWAGYLQANQDVAQAFSSDPNIQQQFGTPEAYAQWHYQNYGQNEGRQVSTTGGQDAVTGAQAQQTAISQFEQSPMFQALAAQGESAILQNASATGGLRGGNTQGALAQFRPALLNQQIQQQFSNLSGLTSIGQNAAAGVGNAGMTAASNISNAYTQAGQAQAGSALATGNAINNALGSITGYATSTAGQAALGKLF